jgi:hypothetical protein
MPATKIDSSQWNDHVLLHNNAAHNLSTVLAQASSGNEVTIDLDQIGPVKGDDLPQNLFLIQPKTGDVDALPLVLYKYQGRFHALVGREHVERARTNKQKQVTGRLLTSVALKKARIIKDDPAAPPPLNPVLAIRPQRPSNPAPRSERRWEFDGTKTHSYGTNRNR